MATEPPPIYGAPDVVIDDGGGESAAGADADADADADAAGAAPVFVDTGKASSAGRVLQLPVDSTLRLKCVSHGQPSPHLIWYKVIAKSIGKYGTAANIVPSTFSGKYVEPA